MTQTKRAGVGLVALFTLPSTFAQVSSTNLHAPPAPSCCSVADARRGHCPPVSSEPEGSGPNAVATPGAARLRQPSPCVHLREEYPEIARWFAEERLAVWRERLRLEDWRISVVMARRSHLEPRTRGKIRWDKDKKTAVVWVMDALDYQMPLREMLDDMEFTIVHELVHLELASLPRSEASRRTEEHAVNRLAEALLKLARGE